MRAMKLERLDFPFARRIAEDHGTVRALMKWIEAELVRQCDHELQHDGPILGPFRVLRDHLREHFRYEEGEGFLRELGARFPEEHDALRRLTAQHRNFEGRMEALVGELQEAARTDGRLEPRVVVDLRCLFQDLRQHDLEEERLASRLGQPGLAQGS